MTVEVYGDIAATATSDATADTVQTKFEATGTTADSGTTVYSGASGANDVVNGQIITATSGGDLTVTLASDNPLAAQVVAGSTQTNGALKVKLTAAKEDMYVKDLTFRVDTNTNDAAISALALYKAEGSGSFTQVGETQTLNTDGTTNPGYARWILEGTARIKVPKSGSSYLLVKPTYVSSGQATVTNLTPAIKLSDIQAEGAAVLVADDTNGSDLVVEAGIMIGSTPTFAADSTATALAEAWASTSDDQIIVNVAPTTNRTGYFAFIDTNDDATYDDGEEIVYVMEGNTSDTTLVVQRGVLGTTAVTTNVASGDNIYFLAGINGNAMTVLNTKLTLATSTDSPSGATTGSAGKIIFKFNAAAENNASDPAENRVVLSRVDITTTESVATVTNLKVYPSEYDNNSSYATTCGALSTTKWRCTMSTTGSTNEIIENTTRTFVVRADVGYSNAGNIQPSIATLGSSSSSSNDVAWTDGSTTMYWVNQSSTQVDGYTQTTTAASGTADTTAPYMTAVALVDATANNNIAVDDYITLTFSEVIDPTTIASTLYPAGSAVTIADGATGDLTAKNDATSDYIEIKNILNVNVGANGWITADAASSSAISLDATGKILTIAFKTAITGASDDGTTAVRAGSGGTTVTDVSGVAMTATGSNSATVTADDI